MAKITVKDTEITIISFGEKDYISLTDIAIQQMSVLQEVENWKLLR
jgi:hypothetical protein